MEFNSGFKGLKSVVIL